MWYHGLGFIILGVKCFFVGTETGVFSPDAVYQVFVTYAETTFLVHGRFRDMNCARRGHFVSAVSHLVWPVGGASVEAEPQLPLCGMSLFCPPPVVLPPKSPSCPPLTLLLSAFYRNLLFPTGGRGHSTFE